MRNPFKRTPATAIAHGVDELLRRLTTGEVERQFFWQMHGSKKLRMWLNVSDRYQTPTADDLEELRRFQREADTVAASLESIPPGKETAGYPDCIRGLVFSNIITYGGERGFHSVAEMWETYTTVLGSRLIKPHPPIDPGRRSDATGKGGDHRVADLPRTSNASPDLIQLAYYMKMLLYGGSEKVLPEVEAAAPTYRELDALGRQPDVWSSLPAEQLRLVNYVRVLSYAFTNDINEIPRLEDLYQLVVQRLSVSDRKQLVQDVAVVLDSRLGQLNAFMPFLFYDPDLFVVSTATVCYATLYPLEDDDPMTGPKACLEFVETYANNNEQMAAGILAGMLALGDWRTLPLLDGGWNRLSRVGQRQLREAWSPSFYASVVEFWLRWLEDVEEEEFGGPASALARLPRELPNERVIDVERRFPAPYNMPPEDAAAAPPIRLVQEWTIEEYARIIEPRLRALYARETHEKVMPYVLEAWGLEPGLGTEQDRRERLVAKLKADVLAMQDIAASEKQATTDASPSEPKQRSGVELFSRMEPVMALSTLIATSNVFSDKAKELETQGLQENNADLRARLLAESRDFVDHAAMIDRTLRQRFGPDLHIAGREMAEATRLADRET